MTWHPHVLKMLRNYPNDPRTPDHLRPNKLMEEAADRIEELEAERPALAKRPVAWRIVHSNGGVELSLDEEAADFIVEKFGGKLQGLYVRDGT